MTGRPGRSAVPESRVTSKSAVTLLRFLTNAFEREGWRNEGDAAFELVQIYMDKQRSLVLADLRVVPSAFYVTNGTTKRRVLAVANEALTRAP